MEREGSNIKISGMKAIKYMAYSKNYRIASYLEILVLDVGYETWITKTIIFYLDVLQKDLDITHSPFLPLILQ